jgi:hypothetical protein
MTQTLVSLSLLLAFITAKVFVPKSIKTLFFIGIATPVATMMVLILALPHK